MTPLRLSEEAAHNELAARLAALPAELELTREFPPEVAAETARAIAHPVLPDADRTDLEFVTIDPPGATDLDQAFTIRRDGDGWRVYYAIADLPVFVTPGGAIDAEAHRRGQTIYAADGRIPLHPVEISEGAASLLPGQERSAYVWEHVLDATGETASTSVARARIRSRRQLDYAGAQADLDAGHGPDLEVLRALREVGEARMALESARGGASLPTPEITVALDDARYRLDRRELLPIESWNAHLSLMTGMAAARLMLDGGTGILRTMPPADPEAVARFRHQTRALGRPWPVEQRYGDYLRGLDGTNPAHLAILHAAASLFRGAGYTVFVDGQTPAETMQAAVGAPYTHVTAPLRRLVDRFGLAICAAHTAGEPVPAWVLGALPDLPKEMARSSNVANRLDRITLESVEAALMVPRIGEVFDAVVLSAGGRSGSEGPDGKRQDGGTVQLLDPAVEGLCDGHLDPGTDVRVRLVEADIQKATVRFEVVA
ncbi:MAG: RNB domain-containing ribonuclease [Microbacteriaceae bacterium]|nr:RNB domain-containing ribonuclease [Microbacteriaceae bacterium]